MRSSRTKVGALLCSLMLVFVAVPKQAAAIPYFARKYHTTCSRCHTAFPKLNVFGRNFQMHGYQQPGDQKVGKISIPEDPNLSVIEQLPVAILLENRLSLDKYVSSNSVPASIDSPTVFHILAADSIAPDIGIFAELATESGVTDVGKISLSFNHLLNQNIHFQVGNLDVQEHGVTEHNLFGGSGFVVQDLDLGGWSASPQHQGARIYGLIGSNVTPSLIHGPHATAPASGGDSKESGQNLHGPMVAQSQQKQVKEDVMEDEVDPMDRLTGYLWEVGVYNGNNSSTAASGSGLSDFSGRVNAYFLGDSFAGLVGYAGSSTIGGGALNHYQSGGLDFSLMLGKPIERAKGLKQKPFEIFGNYLAGTASNPFDTGAKVNWHGFFVEGDYLIGTKAIAYLRYDKVTGNGLETLPANSGIRPEAVTANFTYYLRTNFYIGAEYTRDMTAANQSGLGVLFNFAF